MKTLLETFPCLTMLLLSVSAGRSAEYFEVPANVLADRVHGGLLGQLLGNLNGLKHEMKYIDQPGSVTSYTPALPDGARTDDDTDLEWVYVCAMQQRKTILLPPRDIADLWRRHINRKIWCANRYARSLMDLGLDPPLTGRIAINPWSDFNISGQFICESFGLIAPAMPQTAVRIGLHYTHVTIDGEPAQATQLFTTMIATAYQQHDVEAIVEAGLGAVDRGCQIAEVVRFVRDTVQEHPSDWQAARQSIHDRYTHHGGAMRDRNGYELNTASTVASLLYGRGDFTKTLQLAFNFGWDADNNAATCGAILGVTHGRRWMDQQGWNIGDAYRNTSRDRMPMDETITRFGGRLTDIARQVILEHGGQSVVRAGKAVYRIRCQMPENVEPLPASQERMPELRHALLPSVRRDLNGSARDQARAAYLAICLGAADAMQSEHPTEWPRALKALQTTAPQVVPNIFRAPSPRGDSLRSLARRAGLNAPKRE